MNLWLVRHGESTGNLEHRVLGKEMSPALTDTGRRQAGDAADLLAGTGASAIFSSDQVRAVQTAEIIGARLGVYPHLSTLLREQNHGVLDGRRPDELVAEPTPPGMDISEVRWGGGESVADVAVRLRGFLGELAGLDEGEKVVIVSHRDALCVLLALLAGRGHREVEWPRIGHGEVRMVEWNPHAFDRPSR